MRWRTEAAMLAAAAKPAVSVAAAAGIIRFALASVRAAGPSYGVTRPGAP